MINQQKIKQLTDYFTTQPVDVVYLFGSQATGKATNLSDYDIGILFKSGINQSKRFDLKLEIISRLSGFLKGERVDVVDLEQAPLTLRYSAILPKKEIFTLNNSRRVLFEAETLSKFFDYEYFIKQNTKYSLKSISRMS